MKQNIRVAVDAIVFGYAKEQLKVLLVQQKYGQAKNQWVLPGGFVHQNETLSQAVKRELAEETGVQINYLEQLYTFGDDINRDPRRHTISVAYLALVNPKNFKLKADTDALDAQWYTINEVPKLAFDHNIIVKKALDRLKAKLHYQPIGFDLLNKEFPFSDLENLYKTILDQTIDRRNFRKKILSFNILKETDKVTSTGAGRPAKLYCFDKKKYKSLQASGFHFDINFA